MRMSLLSLVIVTRHIKQIYQQMVVGRHVGIISGSLLYEAEPYLKFSTKVHPGRQKTS